MLQIFGASTATATLPIQIYHMPGGVLGTFKQWFLQTLSLNPVELIYALYSMVSNRTYLQIGCLLDLHTSECPAR